MAYCSRCGVKVEDNKRECPLCFAPIQRLDDEVSDIRPAYPQTTKLRRFTKKEKLFFVWLPLVGTLLTALFIVLFVNLSQGAISWSRYPISSLGCAILILTGGFLFAKKPVVLTSWSFAAVGGLLFLLDLFTVGSNWFVPLAMPLLLYLYVTTAVPIFFRTFLKKNISILFFYLSIVIGCFAPLVELRLIGITGGGSMSWSIIVGSVFTTLSTIFLIYILFVKKRVDMEKFFHT